MIDGATNGASGAAGISLLFVASVSHTVSRFLVPYAAHFRARGWRVDAAANGATRDPDLHGAFDHLYEIPFSRSLRDLGSLVRSEREIGAILATGPDIVHVHTPIAAFTTRLALRRSRAGVRPAVVYTAHGFHFHRHGRAATNLIFLAAERMAGRWTDCLVVINEEDHRAARRHRIVPESRLVRMPGIGIDTAAFSRSRLSAADIEDARQRMGAESGCPLFLGVAELNRNKRLGDAIEALALMDHSDARLALVGEGPDRARLVELVRRRNLRERVRFVGFVDDVRPLVTCATAVVLPSKREGLARSIMEALALGVPVVASTARGNAELVGTDGGLIVPTGDVRGFAAAMDWLVDHPQDRDEMGVRGRARMVDHYDIAKLIRMHEDLYGRVLASRRHRAG